MASPREVLQNLAFSIDGFPISTLASKFLVKVGREKLPYKAYEDYGTHSLKGDYIASVDLEGTGYDAEGKLLQLLADADEDSSGFLLLLESDTRRSPHATPGSKALFMTVRTFDVAMPAEGGKIKGFTAAFDNGDGHRPHFGKTVYTNRGKVPAPMAGGAVVTPAPITLPALTAGMIGVFTVHVTRLTGTGTVTLLAELLSDSPGFLSPVVAATFPLFTTTIPTPGGQLPGNKSWTIALDGDVTPIPGETQWTIRFTATDTGVDGLIEVMSAGVIIPK